MRQLIDITSHGSWLATSARRGWMDWELVARPHPFQYGSDAEEDERVLHCAPANHDRVAARLLQEQLRSGRRRDVAVPNLRRERIFRGTGAVMNDRFMRDVSPA